jgi:hypothetical protein
MSEQTAIAQPGSVQASGEVGAHNVIEAPEPPLRVAPRSSEALPGPGARGTIQDVVYRDVLIHTVSIQGTDSPWLNMLGVMDPFALWLDNGYVRSVLQAYQLVRCGLIITVRANLPGACFGAYNIQALCEGGKVLNGFEKDGPAVDSPWNSTQDVHGFLNVELSNMVQLELPFVSDLDAIPTYADVSDADTWPNLWRLLMFPMVAITSTVGTTAVGTVQFYARAMPGLEVFNPQLQGKKPSTGQYPAKTQGKVGQALSFAGQVTQKLGTIPALAPFAAPASAALAAATTLADMFGFTREAAPKEPSPYIARLFSSVAPVDTLDSSEIVGLFQGNAIGIGSEIGGGDGTDPMALSSLFERWTIVATFDYGSSSVAQTVIGQLPVTPFFANTTLGVRYLTTAGYVGLPFKYWRGTMEYLIYIPSNTTMQGAVQVAWVPSCTQNPSTSDPTEKLCNTVLDMRGTAAVHLVVGYSQAKPVLRVATLDGSDVIDSTVDNFANGCLYFRCIAPLTAPRSGAYATRIVVLARAGDDMVFGAPSIGMRYFGDEIYVRNIAQQAFPEEIDEQPLVPKAPYNTVATNFGEQFLSLRALMQKFTSFSLFQMGGNNSAAFYAPHFPPAPGDWDGLTDDPVYTLGGNWVGNNRVPFNWYGWCIAPFVGVRGSTRWKLLAIEASSENSSLETVITVSAAPFVNEGPNPVNGAQWAYNREGVWGGALATNVFPHLDQQPCSQHAGAEFTLPYYYDRKYVLTRDRINMGGDIGPTMRIDLLWVTGLGGQYIGNSDVRTNLNAMLDVYVAAGPDVSVNRFRRIPGLLTSIEGAALERGSGKIGMLFGQEPGSMPSVRTTAQLPVARKRSMTRTRDVVPFAMTDPTQGSLPTTVEATPHDDDL